MGPSGDDGGLQSWGDHSLQPERQNKYMYMQFYSVFSNWCINKQRVFTLHTKELDDMQNKQQWKECIQVDIKCIGPLYSLAGIMSCGYPQVSVAKEPAKNRKNSHYFKKITIDYGLASNYYKLLFNHYYCKYTANLHLHCTVWKCILESNNREFEEKPTVEL